MPLGAEIGGPVTPRMGRVFNLCNHQPRTKTDALEDFRRLVRYDAHACGFASMMCDARHAFAMVALADGHDHVAPSLCAPREGWQRFYI